MGEAIKRTTRNVHIVRMMNWIPWIQVHIQMLLVVVGMLLIPRQVILVFILVDQNVAQNGFSDSYIIELFKKNVNCFMLENLIHCNLQGCRP